MTKKSKKESNPCDLCGKKAVISGNDKNNYCEECFIKLINNENESILRWKNKGNAK